MAETLEKDLDGKSLATISNIAIKGSKTPTKEAVYGWDSDLKRPTFGDGTTTHILQTKGDAVKNQLYRGRFSAKAGALPTKDSGTANVGAELEPGSYFTIIEAGTIAGISGDQKLSQWARLQFDGATKDEATTAAQWFGNNPDDDMSLYLLHDDTITATVAGGNEILISPSGRINKIVKFDFFDSNNLPVDPEVIEFIPSGTGIGVKIKTLSTKSNLRTAFIGYATVV